jgi:sulfoxide reductase heme-binding subunit YedZ
MKSRPTLLQVIVHVGGWFPLAQLVFAFYTGRMSINPIQEIEQRTGLAAILFLVLSLGCTPLNTLLGWREAIKRRKALGLYAFLYTCLHVAIFIALDYGFAWPVIADLVLNKVYLIVGTIAFLLLIPLALTSFKSSMKSLGMNWIRLHRLVYVIAPLVILHYAWSKKGDLFHLRGDISKPFIYALIVVLLLALRLPFMRKAASALRTHLQALFRKVISTPSGPVRRGPPAAKNQIGQPEEKEMPG